MRTYGQYCALAKALDVVGDRWTLLIVRELMIGGPSRYTDLQHGLPGIATNLLADRLRDLEQAGVVRREAAPPPIATTLFMLTERGEALKPAMHALGRWGAPRLRETDTDDDAFRSHWLLLPLGELLTDRTPGAPPTTLEVRADDQPLTIETVEGRVRVSRGPAKDPDAVISGPRQLVVAVLIGTLGVEAARELGLEFRGDPGALRRLEHRRPAAV